MILVKSWNGPINKGFFVIQDDTGDFLHKDGVWRETYRSEDFCLTAFWQNYDEAQKFLDSHVVLQDAEQPKSFEEPQGEYSGEHHSF